MPLPSGHTVTADEFASLTTTLTVNSAGIAWLIPTGTSAAYENINNASGTFVKYLGATSSKLVVSFNLSCFSTVITTKPQFGISFVSGGTDYDLTAGMLFSVANAHTPGFGASAEVTGLASGTYTAQMRVKRLSGSGVLTMDAGDYGSFTVRELII